MVDNVPGADGHMLGRRTYESLSAYWPKASEEEQAIAQPLDTRPKYVVSTTLTEPLEWENSSLLDVDVVEAVTALREGESGDLLVMVSTQLVGTLIEHDLMDELRVMVDPVVLGGGKRIFSHDGAKRSPRLVESKPTTTGAILAICAPATGS